MPLDITPTTIILDKVRIEQFTISPQLNVVMIQYSRGYNDAEGNYVVREYEHVNLENLTFDQNLYESVKTALYELLGNHLNSHEVVE